MKTLNKLNTIALMLLITGSIDSIRNLPSAAIFGGSLVFFFIAAAIFFLIPTALVSAELTSNMKDGGIYQWTRTAFGDRSGFLAIWLQWINNVVWFPTILSFIASTAAFLISPELAQNKFYLVTFILISFWLLTIINLKGIRVSAKITSFCTVVGMLIPMVLIIVLLMIWLALGSPLQIHLTAKTIFPNWGDQQSWIALTGIMYSFFGMELATVHINDVINPQKTFPKALVFSTIIIIATMVLGSLAIAYVVPYKEISLLNGTIQSFSYFLSAYHMHWLIPILIGMLVIGSFGGIISWIVSPVKGLAQAANHGFLPPIFRKENEHGVPQNLLIGQAILVSFVCLAFLFLPSVNGSYWLLSSLSTQLYILMYVFLFLSALKLRPQIEYNPTSFKIPFGKTGLRVVCALGLIACVITLGVGFIPPSNFNIGSNQLYLFIFCAGMTALILPVFGFYWYQSRPTITRTNADGGAADTI
jgi:amino acid transporter